jgi:predicted nuclease of predicted toxin-antitoxin system
MGIGHAVVASLKQRGHDALHVRSLDMQSAEDEQILTLAADQQRIMLTHDLDFGRLLALSGAEAPTIVTFRLSDMGATNVLAVLLDAIDELGPHMERGAAVTIDDVTIRWRPLPIGDE